VKRDSAALASREFDLLVVGGGVSGAAAAWDAAQRGLDVALVEAEDFGGGASWASLKTVHGGLRHLQRADLAGLRESVRERRALLRIAPEIVRPLPFLVPTAGHGLAGREALALALAANDLLGWDRNRGLPADRRIPRGRMLSSRATVELVPGLAGRRLNGAAVWWDAQLTHGERLVTGLLAAASDAGAVLANRLEVTGLVASRYRVTGARARDAAAGDAFEIRARFVLNAAGAGFGRLLPESASRWARRLPPLHALNLVLARPLVRSHAVGARSEGRFLFLVPWRDRAIVGTAYTSDGGPPPDGLAEAFRAEAARAFPWAAIEARDVALVHCARVPGGPSGPLTRSRVVDHESEDRLAGLVSIVAAKHTTARGVAERAVDLVVARLTRRSDRCRTAETQLPAARPLAGSLEEQARHCVRDEMALTLADVVLRRTDLGTAGEPEAAVLDAVTHALAKELAWDAARARDERAALLAQYRRAVG
jgi:glycerol-3-phosphate dehydrogenase